MKTNMMQLSKFLTWSISGDGYVGYNTHNKNAHYSITRSPEHKDYLQIIANKFIFGAPTWSPYSFPRPKVVRSGSGIIIIVRRQKSNNLELSLASDNKYSKHMGVKFKDVKITQTKTTWGAPCYFWVALDEAGNVDCIWQEMDYYYAD